MPIRRKTNKQAKKKKKTQHKSHKAHTNHWANLRRAETKRKKDFNLGTWEKETSNTISLKKNEKAEKYYTNEGTNTSILLFIAALFTIVRTWKQPSCPLTDEWIKKLWYIYTWNTTLP